MKRSLFTHHKPSETEEKLVLEYKGRYYEVPRSEYHRRLTHIDQAHHRSQQIQAVSQIRSDVASTSGSGPRNNDFFDQLQQGFKKTMEKSMPAENPPNAPQPEPKTTTPPESRFTLEDCTESQQTVVERKIESKAESSPKDSSVLIASTSQDSRQFGDVTDSLVQLKSNVTDLIDRTIQEIESKASLSQNVSQETVLMKRSFGEGNSVKNLKYYAQIKRNKLYGEIEVILKRLQDMELLE